MRMLPLVLGVTVIAIAVACTWLWTESPVETADATEPRAPTVEVDDRPKPDGFVARRNTTRPNSSILPDAVDLTPEPVATLQGRVVLPDGAPAQDALIRVRHPVPEVTWVAPKPRPTKTRNRGNRRFEPVPTSETHDTLDASFEAAFERALVRVTRARRDGTFRLEELRAPATVTVEVEPPPGSNALPTTREFVVLRGDATTTLPEIRLQAGARIEGQVVDPSSNPMANAQVRTHDGRLATTDAAGRFTFDGLPDGTFDLSTAHVDGFQALANGVRVRAVAGHSAFVRIELPRAAHVAGRVVDQDGIAVARAQVLVEFEAIGANGIEIRGVGATTDEHGAFDAGGIRERAECRVSVQCLGYTETAERAPRPKPGKERANSYVWAQAGETQLELSLFRLPRVTLECVDAVAKRPLVATSITVDSTVHSGATLEAFRVKPGQYAIPLDSTATVETTFVVSAAGFEPQGITATTRPRDFDLGRLEFVPAAGETQAAVDVTQVEGRVVDASTQVGIPDAFVDVLGLERFTGTDYEALTDHEGRFRVVLRSVDVATAADTIRVRAGAARHAPEIVLLRDATLIPLWPRGLSRAKGSVTGGVIGRDGKPAAGLELRCNGRSTLTDERGLFAVTRLDFTPVDELIPHQPAWSIEPAITSRLRHRLHGGDPTRNGLPMEWRFDVSESAPDPVRTLDLRPHTGSLRGLVRVNGVVVPGLRVELTEPTVPKDYREFGQGSDVVRVLLATTTASDGSYAFPLLIPLAGELRVLRNGKPIGDPVPVRIGANDDATAHVVVTAADVRGRVTGWAPGAEPPIVTARREDAQGVRSGRDVESVMTRADGSFTFLDLVEGTYTFTARTMDGATPPHIVEVTSNGSAFIDLELVRVHRVVLEPITWDDEFASILVLADAEGTTVPLATRRDLHERPYFAEVPPGTYELQWVDRWGKASRFWGPTPRRSITVDGDARDIVVKENP